MLGITLQQTRFYQDVKEEGREEGAQVGKLTEARSLVLRLLSRRFGTLPEGSQVSMTALSLEQLETLAEALLDFTQPQELITWLDKHGQRL